MKLAGIDHHASFEWNPESNRTHNCNFGTSTDDVDIREMPLSQLPKPGTIDIVVGSPPCTQFSFSNRGGKGDIEDGLVDLHKFLTIVEYLKPQFWAMENVPRVSKIVASLIEEHADFKRFKNLISFNEVVNSWEFGAPQKRKRMICGNFPSDLFLSYRDSCPRLSMEDVLKQLSPKARKDPLYGWPRGPVTDHIKEQPLSSEEVRANRESKLYHPVYNKMPFPDPVDRPSRTVTSLCTRVSRESIVIADEKDFRRLTVRERGVLMGFPVNFQFFGNSYSGKLKMIGNAIPPPVTYHIFNSMLGRKYIPLTGQSNYIHKAPTEEAPSTPPPIPRNLYSPSRNFRYCVPSLRFGSGVRFELSNRDGFWRVRFFFGSSKNIHELVLNSDLENQLRNELGASPFLKLPNKLLVSNQEMQEGWIGNSDAHPFTTLDCLGDYAERVRAKLAKGDLEAKTLSKILHEEPNKSLVNDLTSTFTGMVVGVAFNKAISENT